MREVKTMQKYQCDFCKRRSIKSAMLKHERRCFRNPDRFCDTCQNTGKMEGDWIEGFGSVTIDCIYCSKRDLEKEKAIAEYENSLSTNKE